MTAQKSNSRGKQTVVWWVGWITLTIASFFAASAVWTPIIANRFGSVRETKPAVMWVIAVFGTWMVILLPLIIVMYQKVDKAYEDARIRREKNALRFRSIFVEKSKRLVPLPLRAKLRESPETIKGGHLVTLLLKDGRRITNVFVASSEEILGIYDYTEMPFEAGDIADVEPAGENRLPSFSIPNWLRLDGVSAPE